MVSKGYILIIFGVTGIAFGNQSLCSNDPCIAKDLLTLSDIEGRLPNCTGGGGNKCDAYISDGWYKVNLAMSNTCPGLNNCGTLFPAWLNGNEPSDIDGVSERTVCTVGPSSCCANTLNIKIKKCGNFTAYCLKHLPGCPMGYCFGKGDTCYETDTTTESTHFSTSKTKITTTPHRSNSSAFNTSHYKNTPEQSEKLQDNCVDLNVLIGVIVSFVVIQVVELVLYFVLIHRRKPSTKLSEERYRNATNSALNGIASNSTKNIKDHVTIGNNYEDLKGIPNEPDTSVYTEMSQIQDSHIDNKPETNEAEYLSPGTRQTPIQYVNSDALAKVEKENVYEPLERECNQTPNSTYLSLSKV